MKIETFIPLLLMLITLDLSGFAEPPVTIPKGVTDKIAEFEETLNAKLLEHAYILAAEMLPEEVNKPDWPLRRDEKLHALVVVLKTAHLSSVKYKDSNDPEYDMVSRPELDRLGPSSSPEYQEALRRYNERATAFAIKRVALSVKKRLSKDIGNFIWRAYKKDERPAAISFVRRELQDEDAISAVMVHVKPYR